MNGWRWTLVRSSLRSRACAIRHIRLIAPLPSRIPAPRQPISGITQSLSFLGHPSRWGIWLVAYSVKAESLKRVTPFHRLMGRDRRLLLYAGIHSDGCYVPLDDVAWIPSLLGLPLNQRRQVLLDDASTIASLVVSHSHRLDGITASGS